MTDHLTKTLDDVSHWFLEEYVPQWVDSGASAESDPKDILNYWRTPFYAASVNMTRCLLSDGEVIGLLEANQRPLKAGGYSHTKILDLKIAVHNAYAVGIDVIWSRRRADEVELERRAVHFTIHRGQEGWRIVALASVLTQENSLARIWLEAAPATRFDIEGTHPRRSGALS